MSTYLAFVQTFLLIIFSLPVLYLLWLMLAAIFYRPSQLPSQTVKPVNFLILIPAHNEILTLPATLKAVKALRASPTSPAPTIVVVADNCSDNTADMARAAGVKVLERFDDERRGKGQALEWAITRLLNEYDQNQFSALVVFDADTVPDQNFLKEAQNSLELGNKILQGYYDILKPSDSWRNRLLYTAFVLYNHIRPLGRASLKLSDGLRGNGMVFQREVLEQVPWSAFGLVEDIEYTNRLVFAGLSVTYVPKARVYGQAPQGRKAAATQRLRWEGGRFRQARQDIPPLLQSAIRQANFKALDRAIDLLIPPLAMLVLILVGWLCLDTLLWWWLGGTYLLVTVLVWLALIGGLGFFVLGGLLVAKAPLTAYLALLFAPFYVLWKLQIYVRLFLKRIPHEWERTPRVQIDLKDLPPQHELEKEV